MLKSRLISNEIGCRLLKMRRFGRSVLKLKKALEKINSSAALYVLIDGLDEFPEGIDVLVSAIKSTKQKKRWWISSRPISELNQFDGMSEFLPRMSILPFSYDEANNIANRLIGSGTSFMKAVSDIDMLEFCTQPGGLVTLLRVYKNGHFQGVSTKNIILKIAEDYCQTRKDGDIHEQIKNSGVQESSLIDTLGWMAVCLIMTRNDEFWLWNGDCRPVNTLALRECVTDRYGYDALFATLATRAIEPMGVHRARFSYSHLMCYFAANWLNNNVSVENASTLLRVVAPRTEERILDTQLWLSRLNNKYVPQGIEQAPEFFLRSKSAIEEIGFEKYYNLLERRYAQLTFDERQDRIVKFLSQLSNFDVKSIVSRKLVDTESPVGIEFAAIVARECKLRECLASIVDLVVNTKLSEMLRSTVSYVLIGFKEAFSDAVEFKGLLSIENLPLSSIEQSNIVGNVLDCLWPRHISAMELCGRLQKPVRQGFFGAYERFVDYSLLTSFSRYLTQGSIIDFLFWAKGCIAETGPFDRLGRLSRAVFTYAWKWVENSNVAEAMKECLLEYVKASHHHKMPFYDESRGEDYDWCITSDGFAKDSKKRIYFLRLIVEDDRFSDKDLECMGLWFETFPLYSAVDFDLVYKEWSKYYSKELRYAQRWAVVLENIIIMYSWRINGRYLKKLSKAYPHKDCFKKEWLYNRRTQNRQHQLKLQKDQKKKVADQIERRKNVLIRVRERLKDADVSDSTFLRVVYYMSSENGRPSIPKVDISETYNYKELSKKERESLLRAAEKTLETLPDEIILEGGQNSAILSAAVFVWRKHKSFFKSLSASRVGMISRCVFNSCLSINDGEDVSELMVNFIERSRADCFSAMRDVIIKEAASGVSPGYALRWWKSNIYPEEVDLLIESIPASNSLILGRILERVAAIEGGRTSVKAYLLKYLPLTALASLNISDFSARLLFYAINLCPEEYVPVFLSVAKKKTTWTKNWLLSDLKHCDVSAIAGAFLQCGDKTALDFFVWLEREFPEQKRPIHEAVYSPSSEDDVYEIKDLIIAGLMNNCTKGTFELLRKLPKLIPSRSWDYLLIRCRSKIENDLIPESIPLDELKKVPIEPRKRQMSSTDKRQSKSQKVGRLLIRTGSDLRDAVLKAIRRYSDDYLHGWKFAAFSDIWNDVRKGLLIPKKKCEKEVVLSFPKDEERLSDHLARYLDREIEDIVVTRECQSSPIYLTKNSKKKGAYHDITIEHPKTKSCVIVEVKGNWNKDLKGAGLKDQLQNDYLNRNKSAYGIFVCGCFSSENWGDGDWRRNAVNGFSTKEQAQKSLDEQLLKLEYKERISAIAIDCSYAP